MDKLDFIGGVMAGVVSAGLMALVIGLNTTIDSGKTIAPVNHGFQTPYFWLKHGKMEADRRACYISGGNYFYAGGSVCEHGQT